MKNLSACIGLSIVALAGCKPKSGSVTKSYDALVNQKRTPQECWLSENSLAEMKQINAPLHLLFSSDWEQSKASVSALLTTDSVASSEALIALRRVWLATPPSIRTLFTASESNAQIRLVPDSAFANFCATPTSGTASGEAVDLQACWKAESAASGDPTPRIILTILNEPSAIHQAFIPAIVFTTMESRLQTKNPALLSMQASLRGSLNALGEASVGDFDVSEKGRALLLDFQKRFAVSDKEQLSASIPFQVLALGELLDAAYCSRETYNRFTSAPELPMPKSVAAIDQIAKSDPSQQPWFLRTGS